MRSPLLYLLVIKLKNWIKSFFASPGKVIYLLVILAIIGMTLFSGISVDLNEGRNVRAMSELFAIITAFYSVIFVLLAHKGFSNGANMFSMADVNLIFPAPFQQQKVLFYGLFQQLGTSLMMGLFLLFQYGWLHNVYDIGYGTLLVILLGYAINVFLGQITAMVIYSFTSADDKRKRLVKGAYYAIVGAFVLYIGIQCIGEQSLIMPKAVEALNSGVGKLFPVSAWLSRAISGLLTGNVLDIVIGLLLCAAFLAVLIGLITFTKQDYYEDVLKSAENVQSAITARKEGKIGDASPKNVKIGKTGINKGFGANVIYYKHKLENRRSRALILEPTSLFFVVISIIIAILMKSVGIVAIFVTATSLQIFTVALGRFNKELTKPYIYLIPEPPLKKMLYGLAEALPSVAFEAFILLVPVGFILGLNLTETVLIIIARISFALLFTAVNIVVDRLWGGGSAKSIVMLLYFVIMIALSIPGVILAILMVTISPIVSVNIMVFLSLIVCNIPVSLLAMFICRNMLQYAELNQR